MKTHVQLELEARAREAAEAERQLVQRALEAERRTVEAARAEVAAAEEAAAAERAAKFAADSEARELAQELEQLGETLRQQRCAGLDSLLLRIFSRAASCEAVRATVGLLLKSGLHLMHAIYEGLEEHYQELPQCT
jgi:hypothetical protein